jgi:hypothetical protein
VISIGTLAYIDPGLGSVLIQLLIGGVAGAAFFFRRTLARFRPGSKSSRGATTGSSNEDSLHDPR